MIPRHKHDLVVVFAVETIFALFRVICFSLQEFEHFFRKQLHSTLIVLLWKVTFEFETTICLSRRRGEEEITCAS